MVCWALNWSPIMRTTQAISITLPHDMLNMVKAKVASGEYASESEVIRDGLRALQKRDATFEKFLWEEAARSYDEYKADPSIGIHAADVTARLDARHQARLAKLQTE